MTKVSRYIDLVFCVIVLPLMALIYPIERWLYNFPWYMVTMFVWLYGVYFINRGVTVPLLFKGGWRQWIAVVIIAASLGMTYWLSSIHLYTPRRNVLDSGITRLFPYIQQYQQAVWSLFMIVLAFSFAVGLLTQASAQRARRRMVEAQRDRAEIALYRARIKPHFMFNTLNSLYGLFLTGNENALASLESFISMMRYVHTSSGRDLLPLGDEAEYIRQFVALQSLRLNEMTTVNLQIDISDSNVPVPPMLFVTFVENCFKHGVSSEEKCAIDISLRESGRTLEFSTRNRIFPVKRIGEHMGIANCRKRLEQLYAGRHSFNISDDGSIFTVNLIIHLTPND